MTIWIKPLVWEDADEGMCTKWRAAALGGSYELVSFKGEEGFAVNFYWGRPLSYWFIQGEPDEWGYPTGPKMFPDLEAAKAAAQADYKARILSAIEVPDLDAHIGAVLDDWKSRIENLWITADNDREEGYDEGLGAALEELSFVRPNALQALERVRREARAEFASEIVAMLTAMRGPVDVPRTERAVWVDEGIDRCIGEINDLIEAERGKT